MPPVDDELRRFYAEYDEAARLSRGAGNLEAARTQEIIMRHAPPPPATVVDIGGGPGVYTCWLARLGYRVSLLDLMEKHVLEAQTMARAHPPARLMSAVVGDARSLPYADDAFDLALLLGPLYHLPEAADRALALSEARRVLKPGGVLLAAGIGRYASLLDSLAEGGYVSGDVQSIVNQDIATGWHENRTGRLDYFTTAYFHRPEELAAELAAAGFRGVRVIAVEGPCWLARDLDSVWNEPGHRAYLMDVARQVEADPVLLGVSLHLLGVGYAPA